MRMIRLEIVSSPPQDLVERGINDQGNAQAEYDQREHEQEQQQPINDHNDGGNEYGEDGEDYDKSGDQERGDDGGESKDDEPKLPEGFYLIEAVRKKRIRQGEPQYLVKWRGWPEADNTWEPAENLMSCPYVIDAFEERSAKKRLSRKRKGKQSLAPKPKSKNKQKQQPQQGSPAATYDVPLPVPSVQDSNFSIATETNAAIHIQEDQPTDGVSPVDVRHANGMSKVEGTELVRISSHIGARRRKSGPVKRFKQESYSALRINACDSHGNADSVSVTKIVKLVNYSTSIPNDTEDISLSFLVKRSDGEEVVVDNKYLKENNPLLLINFYEQHLRCSPASE